MLQLYAELLTLHDQYPKLSGELASAAYYTRRFSDNIIGLDETTINKLFRPSIAKILKELKQTDTIEALDELIQLTPAGLFEMMRIKGLGGKKLAWIWKEAKIDTIEGLLKACKKNQLSELPGFGKKTESNIIKAIETYTVSQNHFHYGRIAPIAERLVTKIQQATGSKLVSLCGDIRRQALTIPGIEIITTATTKDLSPATLKKLMIVKKQTSNKTTGITQDEIPVTIHHSKKQNFYFDLFRLTGNESHANQVLKKIKNKAGFTSEDEIYKAAKMNYIVPEMREDLAEWDFFQKPENLVELKDIKGVVHNHTTWSDGVDTLKDFVEACIEKGYEYTVISDHSKNAHYAGGLKEEKVLRQMKEIDALNKKVKPFKIFKSIECDIRVNGDLDYEEGLLGQFDLVIVSIHQLLKMDEEKATRRLIKAIENPYTTILGHMTGRLLLIRPGYPVNYKKVIDACAANNVVIEINANPYRLDMDWAQIPYALKKGVMISVNPDAHSIKEIDNIQWGVSAARKGGLLRDKTWNAMPLKKIEQWIKNKHLQASAVVS
jgi:DNA polymerase (family 10)